MYYENRDWLLKLELLSEHSNPCPRSIKAQDRALLSVESIKQQINTESR